MRKKVERLLHVSTVFYKVCVPHPFFCPCYNIHKVTKGGYKSASIQSKSVILRYGMRTGPFSSQPPLSRYSTMNLNLEYKTEFMQVLLTPVSSLQLCLITHYLCTYMNFLSWISIIVVTCVYKVKSQRAYCHNAWIHMHNMVKTLRACTSHFIYYFFFIYRFVLLSLAPLFHL